MNMNILRSKFPMDSMLFIITSDIAIKDSIFFNISTIAIKFSESYFSVIVIMTCNFDFLNGSFALSIQEASDIFIDGA